MVLDVRCAAAAVLLAVMVTVPVPAAMEFVADTHGQKLQEALDKALTVPSEEKQQAIEDLVDLVTSSYRWAGLPSTRVHGYEVMYGREHRDFRAKWLGRLCDDEATREVLFNAMKVPGTLELYTEMILGVTLADYPSNDDYRVLLEGLRACDKTSGSRYSRIRHIGRAIPYLQEHGGDEGAELAEEGFAMLYDFIENGTTTAVIGGAIDGLAWAGREEEAYSELAKFMEKPDETDGIRLAVLDAASRVMKRKNVDPFFKAWTVDFVRDMAYQAVEESNDEVGVARKISNAASDYRYAVSYLQDVAPDLSLDFLIDNYTDMNLATLLGMDELQDLRWALQNYRLQDQTGHSKKVDQLFFQLLVDAGEKLFHLDEEPFFQADHEKFFSDRDLRYNAASYFYDMWSSLAAVRERLDQDYDIWHHLHLIMEADADIPEGDGEDRLYYGVIEKGETRLLAGLLLAFRWRDYGKDPEADLRELFLSFLGAELSVAEDVLEQSLATHSEPILWENTKEPEDEWMKEKAIEGLEVLGMEVIEQESSYAITAAQPTAGG